jgi:hypothetical protein
MKNTFSTAAAILLLTVSAFAQNATPNFSGTWTMDPAKSDFGPAPPPDSIVMVIDHKEPSIKVSTMQKGAQGEVSSDRAVTTDGKENLNKMRTPAGDLDVKSTTRWTGKTLVTVRNIDVQGMSIISNDTWELSADGRVLTIAQQTKTPQGDFSAKAVFNKK